MGHQSNLDDQYLYVSVRCPSLVVRNFSNTIVNAAVYNCFKRLCRCLYEVRDFLSGPHKVFDAQVIAMLCYLKVKRRSKFEALHWHFIINQTRKQCVYVCTIYLTYMFFICVVYYV